eukprot:evm.model.scf_1196.2 EVM.evm.TU.scf_1196.2   scf_1196:22993-35278(-)
MHIKDLVIDGFKSYAERVAVQAFDPHFNAITGLNGTGKSNILDAICFAMGISNLSQVRASNLQELVYKNGQAGVTHATVSITFDNRNKGSSPTGYADKDTITVSRQVIIGGRNVFKINGHKATPSAVQDLFRSVRLNINNPHFLIMQGRITKVLNMKPPEILAMLEEAAGTKLYEEKKDRAVKTMDKRDAKLREIDDVLQMDLQPNLEKLRKERDDYLACINAKKNVTSLQRFCVAYEFRNCEEQEKSGVLKRQELQDQKNALDDEKSSVQDSLNEREAAIKQLIFERDRRGAGELKELQANVDEFSKRLVQVTTAASSKLELLQADRGSRDQIEVALEELNEDRIEAMVREVATKAEEANEAETAGLQALEGAKNELKGAEAGDLRDASNRSLNKQLADARTRQVEVEGNVKIAENKIEAIRKVLEDQEQLLSTKKDEAGALKRPLEMAHAAVTEAVTAMQALNFDDEAHTNLEAAKDQRGLQVRRCRQAVDEAASRLPDLDVRYNDPHPGFDRSSVKGTVARLVRVHDPTTVTAVEVAAEGRLFNLVVQNVHTAKAILKKGQLKKTVTFIPLDQIRYREPTQRMLSEVKRIAGHNAKPAIECIAYDRSVEAAMKYAFENTLICKDADTAKSLAFNPQIGMRCVTLEGDLYTPTGTLRGGSRNTRTSVLARLQQLQDAERELQHQEQLLSQAKEEWSKNAALSEHYQRLQQDLQVKKKRFDLLESQYKISEAHQLEQHVANSREDLQQAQTSLQEARQSLSDVKQLQKDLEEKVATFETNPVQLIKAAQGKLKRAKAQHEELKKTAQKRGNELQAAVAKKEGADVERHELRQQLVEAEAKLKDLEQDVSQLQQDAAQLQNQHDAACAELQRKGAELSGCEEQIVQLKAEKEQLNSRLTAINIEKQREAQGLKAVEDKIRLASNRAHELMQEYKWIATERRHFGAPGSQYDWYSTDPKKKLAEMKEAQRTVQQLDKKVNKAALTMFERMHNEVEQLVEKRRIVEADKAKIAEVIAQLDEKKQEAVQATWQKVNQEFGNIFSTLLPGTSAKLDAPPGMSFLEGLQIKVAFGNVWKESLSELSGGQKSLLALSLMLAMLLFKPAPIYILDEVDSALDLSHTQNVGFMIKRFFPQSQFLIVSHKDGMFNNANVIFRTHFVDGASSVARTVPQRR